MLTLLDGRMAKTILVVDGSADVITSVRFGLESITKDYQVVGAESGKQCLDLLLHNEKSDLILLEIMMPDMIGWELFNKLKEDKARKEIPVVFLTTRTDTVAKNAGKFLGDDYIEKPFEIQDVNNRIHKVFEKRDEDNI